MSDPRLDIKYDWRLRLESMPHFPAILLVENVVTLKRFVSYAFFPHASAAI
jgi:hypothetical protein